MTRRKFGSLSQTYKKSSEPMLCATASAQRRGCTFGEQMRGETPEHVSVAAADLRACGTGIDDRDGQSSWGRLASLAAGRLTSQHRHGQPGSALPCDYDSDPGRFAATLAARVTVRTAEVFAICVFGGHEAPDHRQQKGYPDYGGRVDGPHLRAPPRFVWVSGSTRTRIELAGNEVDHGDVVAVGAVSAGSAFGGLDE